MNEALIVVTLVATFGSVLLWYRLFGPSGLYSFTAFITIAANIEVAIMVYAFGTEMTLGNVLFAGTFLATDILSEMHGKQAANKCVTIGVVTSISMVVLTRLWLLYTPSASDLVHPAIVTVFSNTPRIMVTSLVVYAVCQLLDVKLYHAIWDYTGHDDKLLWLRNNCATIISQFANALLFNLGAFGGTVDVSTMVSIVVSSFNISIVTSILDTPMLYLARRMAK